jgi:uncharacterized membrane protein YhaH (DUF805 family)
MGIAQDALKTAQNMIGIYIQAFDPKGRFTRSQFLLCLLDILIVTFLCDEFIGLVSQFFPYSFHTSMMVLSIIVFLIGSLVPIIFAQIRRMRDFGSSFWWFLALIVPILRLFYIYRLLRYPSVS